MTANRIILIALWILSLVSISFFGGPLSYGFFAAVTLVPLISLLYTLIVLFRFKIYQDMNRVNVVAGTVSDFYITLQNEDFFPYSGVRIRFFSPFSSIGGIEEDTEYELLPHSGIRKKTSLVCRYRGEYEVGVKSIILEDYLRIFRITFTNREPFRLNVLPRIIRPDSLKTLGQTDISSVESRTDLRETDVTVRDHQNGDGIRRIHWKASAASGKLLVRNLTGEEKQGIGILMDSGRYSDDPSVYLPLENRLSEVTIALSSYFLDHNTPVRVFFLSSGYAEYSIREPGDFRQFYSDLSALSFRPENTPEKLMAHLLSDRNVYSLSRMILILHDPDEAAARAVDQFIRNRIHVTVYLVTDDTQRAGAEKTFPGDELFVIPTEADLKEVL
ncbi:MAG: DUF58 domain-containing protein [Lachnospiraceae bacterium]|nr:DUF58 domain-containing protein [Lachnospiraceae bacterium]